MTWYDPSRLLRPSGTVIPSLPVNTAVCRFFRAQDRGAGRCLVGIGKGLVLVSWGLCFAQKASGVYLMDS